MSPNRSNASNRGPRKLAVLLLSLVPASIALLAIVPAKPDHASATVRSPVAWPNAAAGGSQVTTLPVREKAKEDGSVRTEEAIRALTILGDGIRTELEASRAFERYRDCMENLHVDCSKLWDTSMFSVLTRQLHMASARTLANQMQREYGDEFFARAVRVHMHSSDPVQRVVTLTLLSGDAQLRSIPLDAATYENLAFKGVVETTLLLHRHEERPVPLEAVESVVALATNPVADVRSRTAAAASLANERDLRDFVNVVEGWLTEDSNQDLTSPRMISALVRCGRSCEATLQRMSRDEQPSLRELAFNAIAFSTSH